MVHYKEKFSIYLYTHLLILIAESHKFPLDPIDVASVPIIYFSAHLSIIWLDISLYEWNAPTVFEYFYFPNVF